MLSMNVSSTCTLFLYLIYIIYIINIINNNKTNNRLSNLPVIHVTFISTFIIRPHQSSIFLKHNNGKNYKFKWYNKKVKRDCAIQLNIVSWCGCVSVCIDFCLDIVISQISSYPSDHASDESFASHPIPSHPILIIVPSITYNDIFLFTSLHICLILMYTK